MNLAEAKTIMSIATQAVADRRPEEFLRLSTLKGFSFIDVYHAAMLELASHYKSWGWISEKHDEFEVIVRQYGIFIMQLPSDFTPDEEVDRFDSLPEDSMEKVKMEMDLMLKGANFSEEANAAWLRLENTTSFSNYLKSIGSDSPDYWTKVYERVGLPVESTPSEPIISIPTEPVAQKRHWLSRLFFGE